MATKRGPYASSTKRREGILRAALDLIAANGHHAVTMKLVADVTGVTEPALYYYFPTRDHLLVEVLRYRDYHPAESADHLNYDMLIEAMRHSQQTPWFMALYGEFAARAIDPTHPAHDFFAGRFERFRLAAVDALRDRLGPDAEIDPVRAERIMLEVIASADGLQSRWLVTRDFDIADHTASIVDRLAPRHAALLEDVTV